jgi:PAS domain-containing protein
MRPLERLTSPQVPIRTKVYAALLLMGFGVVPVAAAGLLYTARLDRALGEVEEARGAADLALEVAAAALHPAQAARVPDLLARGERDYPDAAVHFQKMGLRWRTRGVDSPRATAEVVVQFLAQERDRARARIEDARKLASAGQRDVVALLIVGVFILFTLLAFLPQLIVAPLRRLENAVRRAADGDLTAAADAHTSPEIAEIARSLNRLVRDFHHEDGLKVQKVRSLRRTLEVIGEHIAEPCVVLDGARHVEYANPAFREMACCGDSTEGKSLREALPDPSVGLLVEELFRGAEPRDEPLRFRDARGGAHVRRISAGAGRDARGEIVRLVLVFAPVEEQSGARAIGAG